MIRTPIVAGRFYPAGKEALRRELSSYHRAAAAREDAIGAVSPHAGYPYSGPVAADVLGRIKPRGVYIILGPNHTGMGQPFGLSSASAWKTPLGDVPVHTALADEIAARSAYVRYDDLSHAGEHSIEVQLPFLQFAGDDFHFVPIVVSDATLDMYRAVGKELARAVTALGLEKDVAIIASSDMTHYESSSSARKKDDIAIAAVLALDEASLIARIAEFDISMCGYAPTAVMLVAAKELGARSARLVSYRTSGEATGDHESVVGYAGIIIR